MEDKKEVEKKEENKIEAPKPEGSKKDEEPKKEEPKKEDAKEKEEAQQENAVEDKPEETEIPIKKEINQEIGIKNMVGDDVKFKEVNTWEQLGVKESIIKGLLEMSFLTPSKVQSTTFPIIMKEPRFNLIAQAKNGSGKTCAFGLGAISSIDEDNKNIQAVVFAHTRELVIQVHDVLSKIAKHFLKYLNQLFFLLILESFLQFPIFLFLSHL